MQTGEAGQHVTMAHRADQVRRAADHEDDYFTQHMRGTAAALEILLGVSRGTEHVIVDGAVRHVFECFAMANAALCSSTAEVNQPYADHAGRDAQRRSGSPANVMYRNCRPHLRATITALQPTIVLCEGRTKRGESPSSSLLAVASDCAPLNDDATLLELTVADRRFIGVLVPHPCARGKLQWWAGESHTYFTDVIEPLLTHARTAAL